MTIDDYLKNVGIEFADPVLRHAFVRSAQSISDPQYGGLPIPVRFRASGGLQAWTEAFRALPKLRDFRAMLQDPSESLAVVKATLRRGMQSVIREAPVTAVTHMERTATLQATIDLSGQMLAFWLRQGALYEPTASLGGLLGGVDISADLPLGLVQPPTPALCILPPKAQRAACGGMDAVFVFTTQDALAAPRSGSLRRLTFLAVRDTGAGLSVRDLEIPITDESQTLIQQLDFAFSSIPAQNPNSPEQEKAVWKQVLDYTMKVLLYLSLDDAVVQEERPYSAAPKTWEGLGRRKRELRLAQVEQLYDRYIVGPASASDWAGSQASELGPHGQMPAHWRRGHFRLQAHGPHSSLRKLLFIKPMLVRADRLADLGAS